MNWQPIENAQKDSRARLVWCPERQNIYAVTWLKGHGWQVFGGNVLSETPTHWMPLPAAPGKDSPATLNLEAAAMKLAEMFDYPWAHMPTEGRQNIRKSAEAVLLAAGIKESP